MPRIALVNPGTADHPLAAILRAGGHEVRSVDTADARDPGGPESSRGAAGPEGVEGADLVVLPRIPDDTQTGPLRQLLVRAPAGALRMVACPGDLDRLRALEPRTGPSRPPSPAVVASWVSASDTGAAEARLLVIASDDRDAAGTLRTILGQLDIPVLEVPGATLALLPGCIGAWRAVQRGFTDSLARLCDATGADLADVLNGLAFADEPRRGPTRHPAAGSDPNIVEDAGRLLAAARAAGVDLRMIREAADLEATRPARLADRLSNLLGGLEGRRLAVPGLDPGRLTDLARELVAAGARLSGVDDPDARWDALVVAESGLDPGRIDLAALRPGMRTPLVFDPANLLDPAEVRAAGYVYHGAGR